MFLCFERGDTRKFCLVRRGFTLVGKVDSTEERVSANFRDGSRWNSNQGLELGADVLWYLFFLVTSVFVRERGREREQGVRVAGRVFWNVEKMAEGWRMHVEMGNEPWRPWECGAYRWAVENCCWVYPALGWATLWGNTEGG